MPLLEKERVLQEKERSIQVAADAEVAKHFEQELLRADEETLRREEKERQVESDYVFAAGLLDAPP